MKKITDKINDFFFKEVFNYEGITFFRISVGLLLLLHFISVLPDFEALFSTNGVIPSDVLDAFIPKNMITLPKIIYFFNDLGISEGVIILIFKISYITLSLFLIVGFSPRIAAAFLLFLQIALLKGSSFYAYGIDFFTSMSLFYLMLIPSNNYYSVDAFFGKNSKNSNYTPYYRLFQLHLSIAYFFSGFDKVLGFNWWNGESIWKAINLPFSNQDFQFDFSFLAQHSSLLILIGWSTIIIEMLYPVFIWIPKTRKIWLGLTISLHLGIALVLNLYFFSTLMIIWNLTNFYFNSRTEETKKTIVENLNLIASE